MADELLEDLEPHRAGTPAGDDRGAGAHPRAGAATGSERSVASTAKRTDHKTAIIVIVSIVGVVIAYMTYKRTGSAAGSVSTSTPTLGAGDVTGTDPNAPTGQPTTGQGNPYAQDALLAALANMDGLIAANTHAITQLGASTKNTPTSQHHPAPLKHHPAKHKPAKHKPAAHHVTYTVRSGDTLWAIAKRNHMSLSTLEARNRQIHNPNLIHPGEKVTIR